jgi:hypothetical protein
MSKRARVLIIETVVPDAPGPHLSKELDIVMMAVPAAWSALRRNMPAWLQSALFAWSAWWRR